VYRLLLVDEDSVHKLNNGTVVDKKCGGILIEELYPGNYNPKWIRSSYLTPDWHTDQRERRTTYNMDHPDIQASLDLFYVCHQIYREASYIFYSKNRFYVKIIDTLIPFLQDRPGSSIETISIPVPYGQQKDQNNEWIERFYCVKPSTFSRHCLCLSTRPNLLPNLRQLDLRIRCFGAESVGEGDGLKIDRVQISAKMAKRLASVADPSAMTLSLLDWHPKVLAGIEGLPIFQQLPEHVHGMIQIFRDDPEFDDSNTSDSDDTDDEYG
jgi:hypothetical protein